MAREIFEIINLSKQSIPSKTERYFQLNGYFHISNFIMSDFYNNSPITLKFYSDDELAKTVTIKGYQKAGTYEIDAKEVNKISTSISALSADSLDFFVLYAFSKEKSYLIQSNNKAYSLESINAYETNMTSNTSPSPLVASASSVYSSSYPAWRAFDGIKGNTTSRWASSVLPARISLDFGKNTKVNFVELTSAIVTNGTNNNEHPKTFTIQGSNDGQNWIDISNVENSQITKANQLKKFYTKLSNYRFYSLYIKTSNNSTSVTTIAEITFGFDNVITEIPIVNKKNIINYGSFNIDNLNGIYDTKSYILQDEVSRNEEGLYTTKLDRKPLSISFK